MRLPSSRLLIGTVCLLAGCTVTKLKSDNERAVQQIDVKQQELIQARQQQAELEAERQRLVNDLRTRELTLAEIDTRLQELERRNNAAAATTEEQRRQKAQRQKVLVDAKAQIKSLERAPDLSAEAKARRLKEVREELRKTLELMTKT
jgi:septal ring factor EnvC (AmiA/AmiB activator)